MKALCNKTRELWVTRLTASKATWNWLIFSMISIARTWSEIKRKLDQITTRTNSITITIDSLGKNYEGVLGKTIGNIFRCFWTIFKHLRTSLWESI